MHDLRRRVASARGGSGILVFACDRAAKGEVLARAENEVLALPCIAMLPPSFVEYALRRGARGVFLLTCREGECAYRLGTELTAARFAEAGSLPT